MSKKKTKSASQPKKVKKERKPISLKPSKQQKIVLGSFLFFFGIALFISFVSYLFSWKTDQSTLQELTNREVPATNLLSKFGAAISHIIMYKGFGIAAFILAFLTSTTGVYYFFDYTKQKLRKLWFWGILVMLWLAVFFGFFQEKEDILGGIVGFEINDFLQDYLGFIGTAFLMAFLAII
jgi:S-DNA-T family DNA segregation ATPase FtsK/SpoIIIE